MLLFWKVTLANFKLGKLPSTLASSNFLGLFVMKFDSKVKLLEVKKLFLNKFILKKPSGGEFCSPLLPDKIR